MSTPITPEHLEVMFGSLQGCCLHSPVWTPADVAEVLVSVWQGDESGGWQDCKAPGDCAYWKDANESTSYTVARLKDGRFGLLSESEDYTGHGCQCSAATNVYDTAGDLLRLGIEEWQEGARQAIAERLAVPGAVVTPGTELEA